MLQGVQQDSHVPVLQAAGHLGAESGGSKTVCYKASALSLPVKYAKMFESTMYQFLWIGKLEKLKLDEVKNPVVMGGLHLPCVISKADSLFLSSTSSS